MKSVTQEQWDHIFPPLAEPVISPVQTIEIGGASITLMPYDADKVRDGDFWALISPYEGGFEICTCVKQTDGRTGLVTFAVKTSQPPQRQIKQGEKLHLLGSNFICPFGESYETAQP